MLWEKSVWNGLVLEPPTRLSRLDGFVKSEVAVSPSSFGTLQERWNNCQAFKWFMQRF